MKNCSWCGGIREVKLFPEGYYHEGCLKQKKRCEEDRRQSITRKKRSKFIDPYDEPLQKMTKSPSQRLYERIDRNMQRDYKKESEESIARLTAKYGVKKPS